MKSILDKMEEHIAEIRNLQRNFDYHAKRLEKLMRQLNDNHSEEKLNDSADDELPGEALTGQTQCPSDSIP
jgi:DNA repair exonuclease SbcCD ATPase subunit